MALTLTKTSSTLDSLGSLMGYREHVDVTEYATGGWAPRAVPAGTVIGILPIWQENANYNLRWDRTNAKVLAYVMSTGAEAGAVDVGEFEYVLLTATGA